MTNLRRHSRALLARTSFRPELSLEICYAIAALGRKPVAAVTRTPFSRQSLPASVINLACDALATPFLWTLLPDVLLGRNRHDDAAGLVSTLRAVPTATVQEELIRGTFHEPAIVSALARDRIHVAEAVARATDSKREWLAFVGLYPYVAHSPATKVVRQILDRPEAFVEEVASVLHAFWDTSFSATWTRLQSPYLASINRNRNLCKTLDLQSFFDMVDVRISVDAKRARLNAMRGAYSIAFQDVDELVLVPSAFNAERLWTVVERDGKKLVFCPYRDESLVAALEDGVAVGEPTADVALTLRALGDTTRFAIAGLLAQQPQAATDLARALAVSKPTVSHHIRLMRDASLIIAQDDGKLSLRREVIERLSKLIVEALYPFDGSAPNVQRTRRPN